MAAGVVYVPPFPKPSQEDLERILTEDVSATNKNRVTLWKVRLATIFDHSSQEVVLTKFEYISRKTRVKKKISRFTMSRKDYQRLLGLIKLAKSLKKMKLRDTPDEGIQDDRGLQAACDRYHDYLEEHFYAPWHRSFLHHLDLLKYDFDME